MFQNELYSPASGVSVVPDVREGRRHSPEAEGQYRKRDLKLIKVTPMRLGQLRWHGLSQQPHSGSPRPPASKFGGCDF